jgi:hypothetical protein
MFALFTLTKTLLAGAICAMLGALAPALPAAPPATAYDMTPYETMAKETLRLVNAGDMKGALKEAKDLEQKWDKGTTDFKKSDAATWGSIDKQMDVVIAALKKNDAKKATDELNTYLEKLASVPKP